MELASLIERYLPAFEAAYGARLLPGQRRALHAIRRCRTSDSGELCLACPACATQARFPRSCGHRSCPRCQNHEASRWLDRQRAKLLPVEYFLVTFTLPRELRALAFRHQRVVYACLFAAVSSTLRDFGLNPEHLGADIGMTAVLHTHSRRLDYHPHLHVVVPGGGVDRGKRQWRKLRGRYLFNGRALASVFRARLLAAVKAAGLAIPANTPPRWVVHCKSVGKGLPALQYLSRYLYRGVIAEQDIVAERDGKVTFRYLEGTTGKTRYRTLNGADFLWRVLQHVLPKGCKRSTKYVERGAPTA